MTKTVGLGQEKRFRGTDCAEDLAYSLLERQSRGTLVPSFGLFGLPMVHTHAWEIDGNVLGSVFRCLLVLSHARGRRASQGDTMQCPEIPEVRGLLKYHVYLLETQNTAS